MEVVFDHRFYFTLIFFIKAFQPYHVFIGKFVEAVFGIKHVRYSTTHSRSEVPSCFSQHNYTATGHVFASMIANPFDHRLHA
jgi:hypothetical protein